MTETTRTEYTVVADLPEGTAGAIVWWTLAQSIDLTSLRNRWVKEGFDEKLLPAYPSFDVALTRAAATLATKTRLLRTLNGMSYRFGVVDEKQTPTGLEHHTVALIGLDKEGRLNLNGPVPTERSAPQLAFKDIEALGVAFETAQREMNRQDASVWLSRTVVQDLLQAVALRDTGGVYFIPREAVGTYRKVAAVLKDVSAHRLYEVPALKSDDAVDAILDAVLREADGECAAMEAELDLGNLRARALRSRMAAADTLRLKVQKYEALLGRNLEQVHERLDGLKAGLVASELSLAEVVS